MTPIILLGDVSLSSLDKLNQLLFAQLFKKFVQKLKLLCSSNNFIVLKNIIGTQYFLFRYSSTHTQILTREAIQFGPSLQSQHVTLPISVVQVQQSSNILQFTRRQSTNRKQSINGGQWFLQQWRGEIVRKFQSKRWKRFSKKQSVQRSERPSVHQEFISEDDQPFVR